MNTEEFVKPFSAKKQTFLKQYISKSPESELRQLNKSPDPNRPAN